MNATARQSAPFQERHPGPAFDGPSTPAALPLQSFEELAIPAAVRSVVEKELTDGEKILWLGRPSRNPDVHPRKTAFLAGGLGMIALAVGVAATSFFTSGGAAAFPLVFAGALGLFGLIFLLPTLIDPTATCRSCYVVTNRRAMLVEPSVWARGPRATSYLPHQLLGLEHRDHPTVAGAGDLILEYTFALPGNSFDFKSGTMLTNGAGFGRSDAPTRVPRGFFLLDQVREVEDLIRRTLLEQLEQAQDGPKPGRNEGAAREPRPEVAPASIAHPGRNGAVADGPGHVLEHGRVPAELKAKALEGVDPSEQLVWVGQPAGTVFFVRSIAYLLGGSVGMLIALLWLFGALAPQKAMDEFVHGKAPAQKQPAKKAAAPQKEPSPNLLPPAGLLLLSACFASVPFIRRHSAGRTCYALTNRRALVYKQGLFGPTRESYTPLEVAGMRRSDSWLFRGSGDLVFRTVYVVKSSGVSTGVGQRSVKTTHYGFLALPQVREVEKLVRETLIDRFVDKLQQASSL